MMRKRKFEEGGVIEGENAGIGDDSRARAMKWLAEQGDGGEAPKPAPKPTPKPRPKPKAAPAADMGREGRRSAPAAEKPSLYSQPRESLAAMSPGKMFSDAAKQQKEERAAKAFKERNYAGGGAVRGAGIAKKGFGCGGKVKK